MTTEGVLYRNADDPLGVAFDVMVPCDTCDGEQPNLCSACRGSGLMPNPAITQECEGCEGCKRRIDPKRCELISCPDCEGRGWTFRSSVRVAERVRVVDDDDPEGLPVAWMPHITTDLSGRVLLWIGPDIERGYIGSTGQYAWLRRDITHLWEQPCPEHGSLCDGESCCCADRHGQVVPPGPGSVWEIGWREAELVEVASADQAGGDALSVLIVTSTGVTIHVDGHGIWATTTHHFPTPPKPGQRAGVLGDLVLADKARKVEP